jgi:hypothetical protein
VTTARRHLADAEAQRADDDGGQPDGSDRAWQRLRTPGSKREHTQTKREHDHRDGVEHERRAEQIIDDKQPAPSTASSAPSASQPEIRSRWKKKRPATASRSRRSTAR